VSEIQHQKPLTDEELIEQRELLEAYRVAKAAGKAGKLFLWFLIATASVVTAFKTIGIQIQW
jgi:hypothetical protein